MKKIVFLRSNAVNPDPRVEKEARALKNAGYEILIMCWQRSSPEAYNDIEGVQYLRFNFSSKYGSGILNLPKILLFNIWLCRKLITRRRWFDVVHACDLDTALPAIFVKYIFKKKIVMDIFDLHSSIHNSKILTRPIRAIEKAIISNSDGVIIVDESRKKEILPYKPRKLTVVYNSPDAELVKHNTNIIPTGNQTDYTLRIFYAGILSDHRSIIEMISVVGQNKNWHLCIAGFGPLEKDINEAAKDFPNITFIGKIPYSEVMEQTSNSDILFAIYDPMIPNHKNSSANKLFESMLLGKPIIVAAGTGMDQIVKSGHMGYVVKYGDLAGIKDALLKEERTSQEERRERSISSIDLYNRKYSWDIMARRLTDLYRSLEKEVN